MRRGIALTPLETRRDVVLRAAALADELGYEVFSVAEGWGLDSTVMLAELAAATRRITLVAGVLSVWTRTPAAIAMTAATLHQLSGGRFVLGLGASSRQLVEGWHDVGYEHPAARLREVTTRVRALLSGERATLSAAPGARALRLGQPPVPDLPIWLAATGERTIGIAADLADGWFPLYLRRERLNELAAGIAARRGSPITVAAGPLTVVDDDLAAARAAAAACTTVYLAAMGDIYPRLVAGQGLAEEVDLVATTRTVPDEAQVLLDEFTAYGDAATVRDRLESWDSATDLTMVGLPPGLPWPQLEATIRAAAPATT
ncbi:LLM class flavin-dependent oxidoreductase [Actinophytocola oryzae]|uniref:Alkanesulfonate monooxygenase SsuD/methylene tetrahydromethanopterin reductase-like flavin-dependent oxidoreductase (Luciferase family) n=1 Tax=Actinophytocola oryzae TaxID=502181 RepID=A0A4R7W1H3_9PSEU|nr:LLM class flavin-dependent oxidoreductase [Actinophytocola oryzae]TDV56413.1 alkanesulfonate monooxygenase SsuD/methylene tetrahydromethanopterin reductase-like flavin-dependent oxidoreductase (luciferase family) [Actinophytocola oryzae]